MAYFSTFGDAEKTQNFAGLKRIYPSPHSSASAYSGIDNITRERYSFYKLTGDASWWMGDIDFGQKLFSLCVLANKKIVSAVTAMATLSPAIGCCPTTGQFLLSVQYDYLLCLFF
jgi:hypothetical protein